MDNENNQVENQIENQINSSVEITEEGNTASVSETEPVLSKKEQKLYKKKKWKEYKKERKLKRKEARREKRERIKEEYKYAPAPVRFFHLHKWLIISLSAFALVSFFTISLAVLAVVIILDGDDPAALLDFYSYLNDDDIRFMDFDMDEVYAMTPLDEEGTKRIEALPSNNPDDTWTICVYMVGSNLESQMENDLSAYVRHITQEAYYNNAAENEKATAERMSRYADEIGTNGLDMPGYMYEIYKPIASSQTLTSDVIVAQGEGCASTDITEICSVELPKSIKVVIQTGGATRWSNSIINPNRTQRFLYSEGVFSEVDDIHIQDSCDPATLTEFIKFCDDNYKSDHMALVLWDHGGGVTGYGVDEIFNSEMSLKEIRQALSDAVEENETNPYFDIIGFDACLMATIETAATLEGYGKYLVASEEVEPGDGWDYYSFLEMMAAKPEMNSAEIGKAIADTYMDFYTKQNIRYSNLLRNAITFSVVDINKAVETLDAYDELNRQLLKYVAEDETAMTRISRAASKTVRYSQAYYRIYNLIDLGMYIDYLSEIYPEECSEVKKLLDEAVLYKRSNLNLEGSKGLSVYFPVSVEGFNGVNNCLDYVYNISDKPNTNALYYYKISGCLNEELSKHVKQVTGTTPKVLNTKIFSDFEKIVPEISGGSEMLVDIDEELQSSIQDISFIIAKYDEEMDTLLYYGTSDSCGFDGAGNLVGRANGKCFMFDGSALEAELSFVTDTTSTYVARILHNGKPSYLTFTVTNETMEIVINSVVPIPDEMDLTYDAALRVSKNLVPGDTIIPLLTQDNLSTGESTDYHGTSIKYSDNSKIEFDNLPNGQYLGAIVISDLRGDEYYSPVVECTVKNGNVSDMEINPDFVGE